MRTLGNTRRYSAARASYSTRIVESGVYTVPFRSTRVPGIHGAEVQRVALLVDHEVDGVNLQIQFGIIDPGRNGAFVLACVEKIAGRKITVLSAGTDGVDGNSPAAGAVADGETLGRAQALGLDPAAFFRQSDAYTFFQKLDDAVTTGPTGNNLRDLRILLSEP